MKQFVKKIIKKYKEKQTLYSTEFFFSETIQA